MERLSPGEVENAIRIAREMYENGVDDEEILNTLSKTFATLTSELRRIIIIAKSQVK